MDAARYIFALLAVLGLIGLLALALRHYGGGVLGRFGTNRLRRQKPDEQALEIIDSMNLDPRRKLLLARAEDEKFVILLGPNGDKIKLLSPQTHEKSKTPTPPSSDFASLLNDSEPRANDEAKT